MFSKYAKQAPQQGRTVPYVLRGLRNPDRSHPVLHVEYIGESNRSFWLEALAKASTRAKTGAAIGSSPTEIARGVSEEREANRESVIAHSARHMENVFHDDGTLASDAEMRALIMAIPDVDFDALWAFVQNHNNFRDYAIAEDPGSLAEK